ncbi:MAG: 50S ribosomal protein L3 [Desulfobacterales bacterium]|nr:50S ribosomal protein L3 [Desulfobacterales bacterium]
MCKGLIGKKIGMVSIFSSEGNYIGVTALQIGPCVVTQIKLMATDGYDALQIGFEEKRSVLVNKPLQGHFKKSGYIGFRYVREFEAVDKIADYSVGQKIGIDIFKIGETINIISNMKGRGFSGVVKRHGFHGGKATHGSDSHRIPGSIGSSAWPSRVVKGKKMPGHYGNTRKTVKNLKIMDILQEDGIMLVKGCVPGPNQGVILIMKKNS